MLDTVHAIRHASSSSEVLQSYGPLATRALVTLVDYTEGNQRLETWDITADTAH